MPERPASVGSSTWLHNQRDQADSFAVAPAGRGSKAIASAVLGSGGDGRFAGLASAALARGAAPRCGGGPGLAATLLQRLAHPGQV